MSEWIPANKNAEYQESQMKVLCENIMQYFIKSIALSIEILINHSCDKRYNEIRNCNKKLILSNDIDCA